MRAAVGCAALIVLVAPLGLFLVSHGHIHEDLDITVRLVDGDSGRPLPAGTLVATVRYRTVLDSDHFDTMLAEVLEHGVTGGRAGYVNPTRATGRAETVIPSTVYVTRYWFAGIETSKEVAVPRILLVDHPRRGRVAIELDRQAEAEPGEEPRTWRLDLGTIRVPG
ncbi:MAG: hypothetical protein ACYTGN_09880 [Planctomycetota bacterium]